MKKLSIVIFALAVCCQVLAQGKWTYQECIEYAWENNLVLNNASFDQRRQHVNYKAAVSNFVPSLSAYSGYEIREGRSLDPETNGYTENKNFANAYGVNASLLIFNGLRQHNFLAYERYRLEASREEYERQKNDIAFLVIDAYVVCLTNDGLIQIQEEQVDLSRREVHRIARRIELGLSSGSELYEAQARLASDEYLLVQYRNLAGKSNNDLKRLMNLPPDSVLELEQIPGIAEVYTDISSDSLVDISKGNLPEVESARRMLEASHKLVKTAHSSLLPSLQAYSSWGTSYFGAFDAEINSFNNQFKNNRQFQYGIALNIPLLDGFQRRNNLQLAKIAREQAKNDLKITLQNIEYAINQALLDWEGAIAEYASAQKSEESMELAFRTAEKKRDKGLISAMELFQAKNDLSFARAEMLRTRLQMFSRERTINFYLTGSLTEKNGQEDRR